MSSMKTLLVRFGQVRVGLRSYVGTVMHCARERRRWTCNSGGFVAINGDCLVSVFLHESYAFLVSFNLLC